MDGALGVIRVARVVRDHTDSGAGLMDVLEKFHDGVAIFRIKVSGGLVSQENHGIANERACHRDALLLPTGKLRGIVLSAMRHLDAFECVLDFFLALGRGHAAIREGEFDVFVDGEIADEIESLEDEADFAIANARAITELERGDGLAVERVVPFRRRIEKTEDGKEGGFATAGRTGDGEVFAFFDHEINVVEGVSFEFVGEEDFTHVLKIDSVSLKVDMIYWPPGMIRRVFRRQRRTDGL